MKLYRKLKSELKHFLQGILFRNSPPIIVSSIGRSGSTVLYRSLCHSNILFKFPLIKTFERRLMSENSWDLNSKKFRRGVIYKTHALPNKLKEDLNVKVIFVFGSAIDCVMSVLKCQENYGKDWINLHLNHLDANGDISDILSRDILRIEEQIRGWNLKKSTPRLIIKYNSLWKYNKEISEFVGFKLNLPPKQERTNYKKIMPLMYKKVKQQYADLDEYINDLPDFQICYV